MINKTELLRRVNCPAQFLGRNGIQITEIGDGTAKGQMENIPATQNLLGNIHGGALSTLADAVAAMAVCSSGQVYVTIHNTMEYLRTAGPGPVFCEARVRKAGQTIAVSEATITDSGGREIAIGTFSFCKTDHIIPK
ncbi:MAG: PaaI family thioesterase [Oscillospiraceae bacterium]|nr:PaaI family thioesterase [Oscillospiraceae bacterium]